MLNILRMLEPFLTEMSCIMLLLVVWVNVRESQEMYKIFDWLQEIIRKKQIYVCKLQKEIEELKK